MRRWTLTAIALLKLTVEGSNRHFKMSPALGGDRAPSWEVGTRPLRQGALTNNTSQPHVFQFVRRAIFETFYQ
jgi:hypothetical protein